MAPSPATRPPVPATLWATGPTSLDFTQPWPTPILSRALREFTSPGDHVVLLPADTVEPGAAATGFTVVHDADRLPVLAGRSADRDRAARLIVTELVRPNTDPAALRAMIEWAATRLAANGLLVVPAHAARTPYGLLTDPTGGLVAAAQATDLLYLQHIIAAPVDGDHILASLPAGAGPQRGDRTHPTVHVDVLVFLQPRDQYGVLPATGVAAACTPPPQPHSTRPGTTPDARRPRRRSPSRCPLSPTTRPTRPIRCRRRCG